MGESTTNLTGYPSIDKPWLKFYTDEAINTELPQGNIYDYLCKDIKKHYDSIAIDYLGQRITYKTLHSNIDIAANAFINLGIKDGDVVIFVAPSFPEVIYSFYGLNKIGAVSDFFDPRIAPEDIKQEIIETKSSTVVVYDEVLSKFEEVFLELNVSNIILVSAKDSLPLIPKMVLSLKKVKHYKYEAIRYSAFVSKLTPCIHNPDSDVANKIALLEHTGGTTGTPKAVMLTNLNVNSVAQQYRLSGAPFTQNDSWLMVGVPFIAYMLICSLHIPLSVGMKCMISFDAQGEKLIKFV